MNNHSTCLFVQQPNANAHVHIAREIHVANSAAVNAALGAFKCANELARLNFGRATKRASRHKSLNRVKRVVLRVNARAHGRANVHHVGKALNTVQALNNYAAKCAYAPQIVAP